MTPEQWTSLRAAKWANDKPPRIGLQAFDLSAFRYGAGCRLLDMFQIYRSKIHTAYEGRKAPLGHDEQQQ